MALKTIQICPAGAMKVQRPRNESATEKECNQGVQPPYGGYPFLHFQPFGRKSATKSATTSNHASHNMPPMDATPTAWRRRGMATAGGHERRTARNGQVKT